MGNKQGGDPLWQGCRHRQRHDLHLARPGHCASRSRHSIHGISDHPKWSNRSVRHFHVHPAGLNMEYLHQASFGIGLLGVLVIVFGVLCGLVRFVRSEVASARGTSVEEERKRLRHVLGYYLLLGLEFLIAADIIDTLMKPRVEDLMALGAIVLIRTVISYSLNAELKSEHQAKATAP